MTTPTRYTDDSTMLETHATTIVAILAAVLFAALMYDALSGISGMLTGRL